MRRLLRTGRRSVQDRRSLSVPESSHTRTGGESSGHCSLAWLIHKCTIYISRNKNFSSFNISYQTKKSVFRFLGCSLCTTSMKWWKLSPRGLTCSTAAMWMDSSTRTPRMPCRYSTHCAAIIFSSVGIFRSDSISLHFPVSPVDYFLQTVDPLANSRGRDSIRKIVAHYIENRKTFGNGRLTYNNFCVKVRLALVRNHFLKKSENASVPSRFRQMEGFIFLALVETGHWRWHGAPVRWLGPGRQRQPKQCLRLHELPEVRQAIKRQVAAGVWWLDNSADRVFVLNC